MCNGLNLNDDVSEKIEKLLKRSLDDIIRIFFGGEKKLKTVSTYKRIRVIVMQDAHMIELNFERGRFVSSKGSINYQEVLDDFPNAKMIRIITYNISKSQHFDALMDAIVNTKADVQMITNIPSRMKQYYNSPRGNSMRSAARENIHIYVSKLNSDKTIGSIKSFFNSNNHAKIVGTENIVYIGSANYSNESANNYEAGVLIEDKKFIRKLYEEFFDIIRDADDSAPLFNETLSIFQVFLLSIYTKFEQHYKKMLEEAYTDYQRPKLMLMDIILLNTSDLDVLYCDLDELESVHYMIEGIFDENDEDFNIELLELQKHFELLSIEWMKSLISEDGPFYRLVAFDEGKVVNDILQEDYSAEAWEEQLEECIQKSMNIASELYNSLRVDFEPESEWFIDELRKICSTLKEAIGFTRKWRLKKINQTIDNT